MIRKGYTDWPHGQVHYRMQGEGEAIILLGGAPRTGGQFDPVGALLAGRGYCALAPDMPGFGMSDPVPSGSGMATIAGCLPALLDDLGIAKAHLFGLHSGGKVAAAAAANWPDRFASLIVAGKSHSIGADQESRNRTVRAVVENRYFANGADQVDGPQAIRGWAAEQRYLAELWWPDALFTGPDQDAIMRAAEQRVVDHITGRRAVRDFYAANFDYDLTGDLRRTSVPLLVLEITSAAEDAEIGRQAAALVAGIAGASTAELPQLDGPGFFFHAGIEPTAALIADFAASHPVAA